MIPQLIQRLGLLKYLGRHTRKPKMSTFVDGMFTSKLLYALPLVGNVWGLVKYAEQEHYKTAYTKQHLGKLQSLQRQAALLMQPEHQTIPPTPTSLVLEQAGWMSVHQLTAYHILTTALNSVVTGKPGFLAAELRLQTKASRSKYIVPRCRLSLAQEDYVVQAAHLPNMLPNSLQMLPKQTRKRKLREWVRSHIPVKPC